MVGITQYTSGSEGRLIPVARDRWRSVSFVYNQSTLNIGVRGKGEPEYTGRVGREDRYDYHPSAIAPIRVSFLDSLGSTRVSLSLSRRLFLLLSPFP